MPANAIVLGYEQANLPYPGLSLQTPRYACQATDPAWGIASGKVAPHIGGCDYPWGGVEQHATSYKVLVDSALSMVDSTGGSKYRLPPLILSQLLLSAPTRLPPCSAYYLDGYHIGQIRLGFSGCDISYGELEIPNLTPFAMLVDNWLSAPGNMNFIAGNFPVDQPVGNYFQSTIIGGHERDGSNLYLCAGWVSGLNSNENVYFMPGKLSQALGG